jgi:hypothetical protein
MPVEDTQESTQPAVDQQPEASQEQSQTNWALFEKAGLTPDKFQDPYELLHAYDFVNAVRDRDKRDYAIEQLLRGRDLPENVSWREARDAIWELARRKSDPFYQPAEQPIGTDPTTGEPLYGPANQAQGQQGDAVQQAIMRLAQEVQEMQARQEAERLWQMRTAEVVNYVEQYREREGLSDEQARVLGRVAMESVQNNGMSPAEAVRDAWEMLDSFRRSFAAQAIRAEESAPNVTRHEGAPPAEHQPARSLEEALRRVFG